MSFSKVEIHGTKANPDRVYYNATVVNNNSDTQGLQSDPRITFADSRQTPLLQDSSQYDVAVENFSLNGATKTLPLFIPIIVPAMISQNIDSITATPVSGQNYTAVTYTFSSYTDALIVGEKVSVNGTVGGTAEFNFVDQKVVTSTPGNFTVNLILGTGYVIPTSGGKALFKDPTDVTTTIYSVTLSVFNGTTYSSSEVYVKWKPENEASYNIVPTKAIPFQQETDYYYCYSYTYWTVLINKALQTAYANVTTELGSTAFGTKCPFFEFDELSGLFSLNQDAQTSMIPIGGTLPPPYDGFGAVTPAGNYQTGEYSFVGMNINLEGLLSNFDTYYLAAGQRWKASNANPFLPEVIFDAGLTYLNSTTATDGGDSVGGAIKTKPSVTSFQLTNPFTGDNSAGPVFVRLTQDYVSTGTLWSPISSFVIATTQIPVRNEANANPIPLGNENIGIQNAAAGAFQRVLIETPINATTADIWRGWVLYQPLIPTYSSLDPVREALTDIEFQVFWRNRLTNSLIPLRLYNEGTMSIRLLFRRKNT